MPFLTAFLVASPLLVTNVISMRTLGTQSVVKNVILFDGVCNFCNAWVDLLMKVDRQEVFKFSALQSTKGKEILRMIGRGENDISSVVLVKSLNEVYFKSDVPIQVLKELNGGFWLTGLLLQGFPLSLRNAVYDVVASNRYNLLGKREDCRCGDGSGRFDV